MRQKRWTIIGIAALVVLVIFVGITQSPLFKKWWHPPTLSIPQSDEVVELRATVRDFEGSLAAIPEFIVPGDHVPEVLDWLRPADYIREPWALDRIAELGELVIRTRNGEVYQLRFYWTGKNPVVFTRNGVDQFYGKWIDNDGRGIDGGMCLLKAIERASTARRQ